MFTVIIHLSLQFWDSVFVASRGPPVFFIAFSSCFSVLWINSLLFPSDFVCYQFYPLPLRSSFASKKNFSSYDRCSFFTHSFHMPVPPQLLASHKFRGTFNSSYLSDALISHLIIQNFSTDHLKHFHFSCVLPVNILNL